jgi:hypothetical protein
MRTTVLSTTDPPWQTGTLSTSPAFLQNYCVSLALVLQTAWSLTLLTSTNQLNSTGAAAFLISRPRLDGICPTLFTVSASFPTTAPPDTRTPTMATYYGTMSTRLHTALDNLSLTFLGTSTYGPMIGGFGIAILYFILAGRIFVATHSPSTSLVLGIPFLFAATLVGGLPMQFMLVGAFVLMVLFGVTFILARIG